MEDVQGIGCGLSRTKPNGDVQSYERIQLFVISCVWPRIEQFIPQRSWMRSFMLRCIRGINEGAIILLDGTEINL